MTHFLKIGWLFAIAAGLFAQDGTKSIKPVSVARKVALVIGNSNYRYIPAVPPASADADDMAQSLRNLHFDLVEVKKDLNADALISEVGKFTRTEVQPGDLALIYYSGHGGQVGEENYLLPVDYEPPSEDELVERRAYKMSSVRDALERTNARVRVLIFDACRNSPVTKSKSAVGGLGAMEGKPEGTLIAYASAHNQVARYDGSRNSFYTSELLTQLRQPTADLKAIFERVQNRVYERTDHAQTPYLYGFLSGPVYLAGVVAPAPDPGPRPPAPTRVEPAMGTLVIESDVDSTLTIDAHPGTPLKAGKVQQIPLTPGGHIVQASASGSTWRKTVEIRAGEQQAVVVELAKAAPNKLPPDKLPPDKLPPDKLPPDRGTAGPAKSRIEGTWTASGEKDAKFSTNNHRYHQKWSCSLQISRSGDGFAGTLHEEREDKGLDDPRAASDNFTRRFDATFRLRLDGDRLSGVSESARFVDLPVGHKLEFTAIQFTGTLVAPDRLKIDVVWQRDAQGKEVTWSGATLEKRP